MDNVLIIALMECIDKVITVTLAILLVLPVMDQMTIIVNPVIIIWSYIYLNALQIALSECI